MRAGNPWGIRAPDAHWTRGQFPPASCFRAGTIDLLPWQTRSRDAHRETGCAASRVLCAHFEPSRLWTGPSPGPEGCTRGCRVLTLVAVQAVGLFIGTFAFSSPFQDPTTSVQSINAIHDILRGLARRELAELCPTSPWARTRRGDPATAPARTGRRRSARGGRAARRIRRSGSR